VYIRRTLLALLFLSNICFGQLLLNNKPENNYIENDILLKKIERMIAIGVIEPYKSGFDDVRKIYGESKVFSEKGDLKMCYISSRAKDSTAIIFISTVISGNDKIAGYEIYSKVGKKLKSKCYPTNKIRRKISTNSGVSLDISKVDLIKKFGLNRFQVNNGYMYTFKTNYLPDPKLKRYVTITIRHFDKFIEVHRSDIVE